MPHAGYDLLARQGRAGKRFSRPSLDVWNSADNAGQAGWSALRGFAFKRRTPVLRTRLATLPVHSVLHRTRKINGLDARLRGHDE